jgi:RimJ/RimL family protein N-acetyltransferase
MSRSEPYFLKTPRLGFSHWTKEDLPLALAIWGDPAVTRFVGGPFSAEQVAQRLEREISSVLKFKVQYWPIFLLATGEHVGCAGMRIYNLQEKIYALGFYLRPPFWGQGFSTEAGRAVITYAFDTLGASALFAGHNPENTASRTVLARFPFHSQTTLSADRPRPRFVFARTPRLKLCGSTGFDLCAFQFVTKTLFLTPQNSSQLLLVPKPRSAIRLQFNVNESTDLSKLPLLPNKSLAIRDTQPGTGSAL